MFNRISALLLVFFVVNTANACDNNKDLKKLIHLETNKLLVNAPTFKHGLEDKEIQLNLLNAMLDKGHCLAKFSLMLPQKDLDEASHYLNENPAKKILLAAQGYAIPEKTINEVPYHYEIIDGEPKPVAAENAELKGLYNNIEYTYQLLAQLRIDIDGTPKNSASWTYDQTKSEYLSCVKSKELSEAQCNCRVKKLSDSLSPRKMELINFIQSQPYSVATGAMNSYLQLSKSINESCSK